MGEIVESVARIHGIREVIGLCEGGRRYKFTLAVAGEDFFAQSK